MASRLENFKKAEELAQKSRLTRKDVDEISGKVNEAMGKHARKLLKAILRKEKALKGRRIR